MEYDGDLAEALLLLMGRSPSVDDEEEATEGLITDPASGFTSLMDAHHAMKDGDLRLERLQVRAMLLLVLVLLLLLLVLLLALLLVFLFLLLVLTPLPCRRRSVARPSPLCSGTSRPGAA